MDLSDADLRQRAEADRREVNPPIEVEKAIWSTAGQVDWWVKTVRNGGAAVRGVDGRQWWVRAVDLRPASDPLP